MGLSFEQALTEVWRQALAQNAKARIRLPRLKE